MPSLVHRALQISACRRPTPARLAVPVRGAYCTLFSTSHVGASKTSTTDSEPEPNQGRIKHNSAIPRFSEDSPADLPRRVSSLLQNTPWTLTSSQMGVSRKYTFKSFGAAWKFMSLVADECKRQRHHPSWHNLYNEVNVEWTTHKPQGLSVKDADMAEFCDRTANAIGLK